MYISKKDREIVRNKFGGRCAYSGTVLEDDWQVDHVKPIIRQDWAEKGADPIFAKEHKLDNLYPTQRRINQYKGSLPLELFRTWYLGELHLRLRKLPKNTRSERTIKRKAYLLAIAAYFGITEETPFSGKFYFETINRKKSPIFTE